MYIIDTMKTQVKGTPSRSLFANTLGFFVGLAAVALFSTLAKYLTSNGISGPQAALLISIPNLTGSLLRIPFSAWVDTTGGKKPFTILLVVSTIGLAGVSIVMGASFGNADLLSQNYPLLLIFGALAGCGIATFSVGTSQTSYWFPKKGQGVALAKFGGYGNLGPGVFTLLLTWVLLPYFGILNTYYIWTAFLLVGTVIYISLSHNAWYFQLLKAGASPAEAREVAEKQYGQELFPAKSLVESLMVSAKVWKIWVLVFIYFLSFGGFLAITAWLPTYFRSYHAIENLKIAGLFAAAFGIATSLSRALIGGPLSDKYGGKSITLIFLVVALVGFLVLTATASGSIALAVIGTLIVALGLGVVNASVFKFVPIFTPTAVGGSSGWIGGLGALGAFVFPNILAAFAGSMGTQGYATGYIVFAVWAVISFLGILCFKTTKQ